MKERIIKKIKETTYNGKKYTIMVMGFLYETKEVNGVYVLPVSFNGRDKKIRDIELDKQVLIPGFKQHYSKTKCFNMGWSICNGDDEFDINIGERICRRRLSKSPMTTQNGRFLTKDMCQAIVDNEVNYIENNIGNFLPDKKLEVDKILNRIYPCDFVHFEVDGKDYVGIYKNSIYSNDTFKIIRREMYFHAPIDKNGLIEHRNAKFFESISPDVVLKKGSNDDEKLVNAYLRGAHNKQWDSKRGAFSLIVE